MLPAAAARADEIKLKDGSKIIGTIVGFEDNSFKVKTSYGFAVVQKDQVVSIVVTDSAKKPEPSAPKVAAAPAPASAPRRQPEKPEHAVAPPPKPAATDSASNDDRRISAHGRAVGSCEQCAIVRTGEECAAAESYAGCCASAAETCRAGTHARGS